MTGTKTRVYVVLINDDEGYSRVDSVWTYSGAAYAREGEIERRGHQSVQTTCHYVDSVEPETR